ncbi:hypothetical protein MRY87_03305, partial [bacterium]|nr:hypothetical protein [bacterium]
MIEYLQENDWAANVLKSLCLVVLLIALRVGANIALDKRIASSDLRLRWRIQIRNASFVLFFIGLIAIWGTELRTLALSLVAVAVAQIIATKEKIMCLMGSVFNAKSGSLSIGDRIILGEYRG